MSMTEKLKVACFGDNCVDYYDETGDAFFGGNPLNVAVYLRRLDCGASYLGAVGSDRYGRELLEAVSVKGVDVSHTQIMEGATAMSHVSVRDGDRVFGDYDEGVMERFALREEDFAFIAQHDAAVTGLWGHCENDLARIRRMGIPVVFDSSDKPDHPASAAARENTDIFFFSDDKSDDEALIKKLKTLTENGPRIAVATRGIKGSLAWDGRKAVRQEIIPCEVRDTMGAGDSFIAGFLYAYLKKNRLQECMRAGALSSARTLQYSGAWTV